MTKLTSTVTSGTDWYDQAYSETVLDTVDGFDASVKWYCILGGAQQLAIKMAEKLPVDPNFNSPVSAIKVKGNMSVDLHFKRHQKIHVKNYNAVISTTTLGAFRHIDTADAGLKYSTKQAIRSLGYNSSTKVGIKFSRAWWIHDLKGFNVKKGGLGHSDLNIRTCVYPSYNIYDDPSQTAVLLCSYSWQQDALFLGSLISNNPNHAHKVADEVVLKELLFRDLAKLHQNDQMGEEELYKLIKDSYIDHHAWDWNQDPHSVGAFAFFRPEQFRDMWPSLIEPSGDVVLVGEHASPHHAWVVGSLESVIHGLYVWMGSNLSIIPAFKEARAILEKPDGDCPFVGLPPYMDSKTCDWHSVLGLAHRERHLSGIGASSASLRSSLANLKI